MTATKNANTVVVILAAGLGTRMQSHRAKVLHTVAGRPLLFWSVAQARTLKAYQTIVVLGHQFDTVKAAIEGYYGPEHQLTLVAQEQLLGTGDAVRRAINTLGQESDGTQVVILYGDVPLIRAQTLQELGKEVQQGAVLALVSAHTDQPTGYGRLVRNAHGQLLRVVEEQDASSETREITEINAGFYAVSLGWLRHALPTLRPDNKKREFYLTDLVKLAFRDGHRVVAVEAPIAEVVGVNTRRELAHAQEEMWRRIAHHWMEHGVTLNSPSQVYIDADVAIDPDVELGSGVHLRGTTRVGARTCIDNGCVLTDATVESDVLIKPYCVLSNTFVGSRAQIGPFAHCRPGTTLGEDVHLGNFVETKATRMDIGAKANHLSYLGDTEVGAGANVGAGTITCNYDGKTKHKTVIEAGAFIGSDTQLVAPVTVGKGAYVGAGTTVTRDVPAGALALSRVDQVNVEGYVARKQQKNEDRNIRRPI